MSSAIGHIHCAQTYDIPESASTLPFALYARRISISKSTTQPPSVTAIWSNDMNNQRCDAFHNPHRYVIRQSCDRIRLYVLVVALNCTETVGRATSHWSSRLFVLCMQG